MSTTVLAGASVPEASANHPVFVEGNCPGPADRTTVDPGTCGDYDGDGRIGTAEDTDEPDRVFGTINGALGPGNFTVGGQTVATGANQNGRVIIVASGVFPEVVQITGAMGNVSLEAVPGVEADIDAVLQGDPANAQRQQAPGIVVDSPANRQVTIRNIVSRNWTDGIQVKGDSRVTIDQVRLENNVNYGVNVVDDAHVAITNSQVNGSGERTGAGVSNRPNPGIGIAFRGNSFGVVAHTTVTNSVRAGIASGTESDRGVSLLEVVAFDNNPDFQGEFDVDDDDRTFPPRGRRAAPNQTTRETREDVERE